MHNNVNYAINANFAASTLLLSWHPTPVRDKGRVLERN